MHARAQAVFVVESRAGLQTIRQPLFTSSAGPARTPRPGLDREVLAAQRLAAPPAPDAKASQRVDTKGRRAAGPEAAGTGAGLSAGTRAAHPPAAYPAGDGQGAEKHAASSTEVICLWASPSE